MERADERLPPPLVPSLPQPRYVRVPRLWDLNPPPILAAAVVILIILVAVFFKRHPERLTAIVGALHAPGRPPQQLVTSNTRPSQPEPILTVPDVVSAPKIQDHTFVKHTNRSSRPSSISNPGQTDDSAMREQQQKVLALAEEAKQEEERLRVLKEQTEKEARDRAEAAAIAERQAREQAEARLLSERTAREKAEATARAEKAARDQAEREAAEKARIDTERIRNYAGPRFGSLEWSGEIHGTELITVENGHVSSGSITGDLPGVPVLVQPVDAKKVAIASSPAPRNNYKSLVFRVSGNGRVKITIRWTLP